MPIYENFGNGDEKKGLDLVIEISERLLRARNKHPYNQEFTINYSLLALKSELLEVEQEIIKGDLKGMKRELLDVICVAIRMYNLEFDAGEFSENAEMLCR